MPHRLRPGRSLLLLSVLLPFSAPGPARAFDTGPHHDMTRSALQDEGFAPGSPVIQIAQVSNWLVDYYSSRPSLLDQELQLMARELAHLHFDNLTSPAQIRNAWIRLAQNTQAMAVVTANAVKTAPNAGHRYRRLVNLAVLIGASLHPVQDFYSHSNWVELYPMRGGVYGTRTWFDTPAPSAALRTGLVGSDGGLDPSGNPTRDHGGYDAGMNHDSYNRPGWSQAYVYGYSASRQWLRALRQWVEQVDPAIWQELMALQVSAADRPALQLDLDMSYRLSLWLSEEGKNGTWKGSGSGAAGAFRTLAVSWVTFAPNSIVINSFRGERAYRPITRDMDRRSVDPGPAPAMPRVALGRRAVEVRTLRAAVLQGTPDGILNQTDLYARVTIGGQTFVEATQQGQDEIRPDWLSVAFVPDDATVVPVRYELWDEDDIGESPNVIDVGPAARRTFAEFQLQVNGHRLSGDLSGVHDSEATAATLLGRGGDDYPASVILYVTARELEDPHAGTGP